MGFYFYHAIIFAHFLLPTPKPSSGFTGESGFTGGIPAGKSGGTLPNPPFSPNADGYVPKSEIYIF